jgi:hypothetical protein
LLGRKVVAVDKGIALRVVGRVNIDQLDLAKVAVAQQTQSVDVVAFNEQVASGVPVFALFGAWFDDFLYGYKSAVVGLSLAYPTQLVAVFLYLDARRVRRV